MKLKPFYICSICLFLLLFGCTILRHSPNNLKREELVGYWFGVHKQSDIPGDIQEICHMKADGGFNIRFRVVVDGKLIGEQNESGYWQLDGNIKTVVTTHINGRKLEEPKYYIDKYLIKNITESEIVYEEIKSGIEFKDKRVNEGFDFP